MSGHIFPIKLMSLYSALNATGVLKELAHHAAHFGLRHDDDMTRIFLCSPEVVQALRAQLGVTSFRVRIAFPADAAGLQLTDDTVLEVYSAEGTLVTDPVRLTDLTESVSNAVQVELLQLLLKSKGIEIPLL